MITTLLIPIHSLVDVITNSSSEIFVQADKSTVNTIKKLVTTLLAAAGATITADDLFTFELVSKCFDSDCNEVFLTDEEIKVKQKEVGVGQKIAALNSQLNSETVALTAPQRAKIEKEINELEDMLFVFDVVYPCTTLGDWKGVRVSVKDKTNKNAVMASKILSNLTSMFEIESTYS
jgi:hypothetical protein